MSESERLVAGWDYKPGEWHRITDVPPPRGKWLVTWREGESGYALTATRDGEEWVDQEGRTTVTHSTFLPPTHWFPVPPPRELKSQFPTPQTDAG